MSFVDGLSERAVRARMGALTAGCLTLRHADTTETYGPGGDPSATLDVHDPDFFRRLAFGGHIGAAESYVRGEWSTDDLTTLVRLFAQNRETLESFEMGWARISQPLRALLRWRNRNTRRGSARNIHAHYDLGNDFFASFLDDTMTYSCGIFADERTTMREASIAKYDRLCRKLALRPGDRVVEIGSGWGGFAIHAATRYGCEVTTTTISAEQHRLASRRVSEAGVDDRVTVLLRDYRDLSGTFDKLVSIEMIEAVGHQFVETYFAKCSSLLAPRGVAAIQAITIQEELYDPRQRQVDFIKRYIFPGSFIPAVSVLRSAAATHDLELVDVDDITPHYVETLRRWRTSFLSAWDRVRAMGFDESFRRLWEFYLCYCEGGFAERVLGDVQLVFAKR